MSYLWASMGDYDVRSDGLWWRKLGDHPRAGRCDSVLVLAVAGPRPFGARPGWSVRAYTMMPVDGEDRLAVVEDVPEAVAGFHEGDLDDVLAKVDEAIPCAAWVPIFDVPDAHAPVTAEPVDVVEGT